MQRGVMQEIRDLLVLGKSSRDIINLGYAPGTVYRLQREQRAAMIPQVVAPPLTATAVIADKPEASTPDQRLEELMNDLRRIATRVEVLDKESGWWDWLGKHEGTDRAKVTQLLIDLHATTQIMANRMDWWEFWGA